MRSAAHTREFLARIHNIYNLRVREKKADVEEGLGYHEVEDRPIAVDRPDSSSSAQRLSVWGETGVGWQDSDW